MRMLRETKVLVIRMRGVSEDNNEEEELNVDVSNWLVSGARLGATTDAWAVEFSKSSLDFGTNNLEFKCLCLCVDGIYLVLMTAAI
jgi:hypothetical protein